MDFIATESIARQHIEQLRQEAAVRRQLRGDKAARRPRPGVRDTAREALGYRLVVLGWRLLDSSPRVAERPAR
jgi:hypothetical protein